MNRLTILAPAGVAGGVIDHARLLARHLPLDAQVVEINRHSIGNLQVSKSDAVLLSYSGYGYHKHGAPAWIADWTEKVSGSVTLFGTFFHELYATSPPWRRAFWFSVAQKRIARRLAQASGFILTSRSGYWDWIGRVAGSKPHLVAPIFSNVGELECRGPWVGKNAVVFGSAPVRSALYRNYLRPLAEWARVAGVCIHDIGEPVSRGLTHRLREAGVVTHGSLADHEVSERLRAAGWGLMAYKAGFLAKSSIFAAYASHGLCPIVMSSHGAAEDGLRHGLHYLRLQDLKVSRPGPAPEAVATAVYEWYQPHSVARQAAAIQVLMKSMLPSAGQV